MAAATVAGGHQVRVTVRWLNNDDLFPTWHTVLAKHSAGGVGTPGWSGVAADYPTWQAVLDNAGLSGVEVVEDLSCDVTGLRIVRGRQSILDHVRAGTLRLSLNDPTGRHDPRITPGGPSRTGASIRVEVMPAGGGWMPLFAGFVESWSRRVDANDGRFASQVNVEASDAFNMMARARPVPAAVPQQGGVAAHTRVDGWLDHIPWNDKWGARDVRPSVSAVTFNPTLWEGDVLDEIHKVERSEDGLFDVTAGGVLRFRGEGWRSAHSVVAAVVDLTCSTVGALVPVSLDASDDDLDVVNRVFVSRSVEFDADLPGGGRPRPVPVSAEDPPSISAHGVSAVEWRDLPHQSDARSGVLASRVVARMKDGSNRIGDLRFSFTRRPHDAATFVALDWGDRVRVRDEVPAGTVREDVFEVVGVEHDITADHWEAIMKIDHTVPA